MFGVDRNLAQGVAFLSMLIRPWSPLSAKKRAGSESLPSQLSGLYVLRQLSTDSSNDDGGGGNSGVRWTNSMMARNSSHSTDMVGSIHTDNIRIHNPDSQFRPKSERQNAARERKPSHLPPMQLREAFSYNFPFLFVVLLGMEAPAKDFLDALKMRVSLNQLNTRQRCGGAH